MGSLGTVFISYSHDSKEHVLRVLDLSNKLRSEGIDCVLDQYENSPSEGWPKWMDKNIRNSQFVIMICTEPYYRRVMGEEEPEKGLGVMWESKLIYQHIYNTGAENTKFIPVIFSQSHRSYIPTPLQSATYHCVETQEGYDDLYSCLRNKPKVYKPELGKLRALPIKPVKTNPLMHLTDPKNDNLTEKEPREEAKDLIALFLGIFLFLLLPSVALFGGWLMGCLLAFLSSLGITFLFRDKLIRFVVALMSFFGSRLWIVGFILLFISVVVLVIQGWLPPEPISPPLSKEPLDELRPTFEDDFSNEEESNKLWEFALAPSDLMKAFSLTIEDEAMRVDVEFDDYYLASVYTKQNDFNNFIAEFEAAFKDVETNNTAEIAFVLPREPNKKYYVVLFGHNGQIEIAEFACPNDQVCFYQKNANTHCQEDYAAEDGFNHFQIYANEGDYRLYVNDPDREMPVCEFQDEDMVTLNGTIGIGVRGSPDTEVSVVFDNVEVYEFVYSEESNE